ncbi:hypothetical protein ACJX0J_040163 [Zea mays]
MELFIITAHAYDLDFFFIEDKKVTELNLICAGPKLSAMLILLTKPNQGNAANIAYGHKLKHHYNVSFFIASLKLLFSANGPYQHYWSHNICEKSNDHIVSPTMDQNALMLKNHFLPFFFPECVYFFLRMIAPFAQVAWVLHTEKSTFQISSYKYTTVKIQHAIINLHGRAWQHRCTLERTFTVAFFASPCHTCLVLPEAVARLALNESTAVLPMPGRKKIVLLLWEEALQWAYYWWDLFLLGVAHFLFFFAPQRRSAHSSTPESALGVVDPSLQAAII